MAGIHYQNVDLPIKTRFQHFVNGLPVDPSALHSDIAALSFQHPIPQLPHFRDECAEGADLDFRIGAQLTFGKTGNDNVTMNIQSHGAGQYVLHQIPP